MCLHPRVGRNSKLSLVFSNHWLREQILLLAVPIRLNIDSLLVEVGKVHGRKMGFRCGWTDEDAHRPGWLGEYRMMDSDDCHLYDQDMFLNQLSQLQLEYCQTHKALWPLNPIPRRSGGDICEELFSDVAKFDASFEIRGTDCWAVRAGENYCEW